MKKLFTDREDTQNGRKVTFRGLPGDVERAIAEWLGVIGEVIKAARTAIKEDYVFRKITEMIEDDVVGVQYEQISDELKLSSRQQFWVSFQKRYSQTNLIPTVISNSSFWQY